MFVRIGGDGAVSLAEPEDLKRLSVRMAATEAARRAVASVGRPDGADHVWIAPDRLRALAGDVPAGWDRDFGAMVAYAASKGWTDAEGALRAHIETG